MHLSLNLFPLLTLLLCILTPTQASPHATTIQSDHNNLLNWVQNTNNRLSNFDGSISKGFPLLQTAYEMYQLTKNLETHTQNIPAFDDEDSATLYNATVEFRTAASDLVNRFATKVRILLVYYFHFFFFFIYPTQDQDCDVTYIVKLMLF